MTNRPDKEFKSANIKAAIWQNQVEQDGKTIVQHSIKLQKSYQDKAGDWKHMEINIFPSEIPSLQLVLNEAFGFCMLR